MLSMPKEFAEVTLSSHFQSIFFRNVPFSDTPSPKSAQKCHFLW